MTKYHNGLLVPSSVRTERILSDFASLGEGSYINYARVSHYYDQLKFGHDFEPITGYPGIITMAHIEEGAVFMTRKQVTEQHLYIPAWWVIDGHHRVLAAIWYGKRWLNVRLEEYLRHK